MRAQDLAAGERRLDVCVGARAHALGDRPLGLGELLRLQRAQPGDGGGRGGERFAGEPLRAEPPAHDGELVHGRAGQAAVLARQSAASSAAAAISCGRRSKRARTASATVTP